jgi:tripeptide aminopeptidase
MTEQSVTADVKPSNLNEKTAVDHLMALLAVEGLSGEEAEVSREIRKRLENIGCRPSWIRHDNAHKRIGMNYQVGNLIVRIPGKGSLRNQPRRMFSGHMDTVPLCRGAVAVIKGPRIVSSGRTALGGDSRTAVAAMVTLVETLLSDAQSRPPITLLFTVGEETGLNGAKEVRMQDLGNPAMGFNIDGGNPKFAIVGAIGADRWVAGVHGRSTHAGVYPQGGISATLIASRAISKVAEKGFFGKIDVDGQQGTSNIGMISGGEATNQVTDFVRVTGECRSHSKSFLKKITSEYRKAFEEAVAETPNNRGDKGRVEFDAERDYDAFKMSSRAEPVVIIKKAVKQMSGEAILLIADGGLDANYLNLKGLPTVTLGAGAHGAHTIDESVVIAEYLDACRLLPLLATC